MQTIFAFQQCKEANYGLGLEYIRDSFAPDLNSMEVQDRDLLAEQRDNALDIYRNNYKAEDFRSSKGSSDKINNVVNKAILDYYQRLDKDFRFLKKQMVLEAEKVYERYLSILNLVLEFADLAESDNKLDHGNFVNNAVVTALRSNKSLEEATLRKNISWEKNRSDVRQWFKEQLKADATYINYLKVSAPTFDEDKDMVNRIVKDIIFKSEVVDKFMEETNLNWEEDRPIIKSLATKTIKSINADAGEEFELQELSYNWEDDKAFFIRIFEETINLGSTYEDLISKKTRNWEIERIALTDKIILEMAICEMTNFPSIPVKVTINEYIEVAKRYSTPKSKTFINGVLDVIATELADSGAVRKSGRGLIDNK